MFDYLDWRGDLSFESAPINAVDLLIFATLSYCPLERMPGGFTPGTLAQLTAELYPPDAAFRNDAEKQRCQLWKNDIATASSTVGFWSGVVSAASGASAIAFS